MKKASNMEFRNVVFNAARDGKLRRLKVFLDHRPREEVAQLVSARTNGATPLVLSCRNGHKDVVEYLVERCKADVEQPGSVTFDGETIEGAPPLWCAAAAGHLEIVRLLIQNSANVNSTTKTNSTPLRAACFDGHFEIVQFLVQNGADMEVANRHGHTCLMIACYKGHYKIAKYLMEMNANVNRKSIKGNTALHDCAESGSLEIMKLLLANGARIDKDSYGMTPLLAAAVTGHIHIVEYLISNKSLVSREERVDSLDLLGATFVDKKRDMLGCYKLWRRSLEDRHVNGVLVCPKRVTSSPIAAYENTLEVQSVEQLEDIISDPDEMRMQALLVRERILGPAHPDTSYYIRYRGAVYADMGQFERCITLWMYALDMQQKMLEPLSPMTQSSLLSFAELFSYMMSETRQGNTNNTNNSPESLAGAMAADWQNGVGQGPSGVVAVAPTGSARASRSRAPVNFCDIMVVFEKAVKEIKSGLESFLNSNCIERDATYFHRTLVIILHLICLLTKLLPHLSVDQVFRVKQSVFNLLQLDPRGRNGTTPLHLACARESSSVGRYPICAFPSIEVIKLLVECGANPNGRDFDYNTPLHMVAILPSKTAKPALVATLLECGAHLDTVNINGKSFADFVKVHEVINEVKFTSLQCLAARVVKKHRLHLKNEVPHLIDFVEMH